MSTATTQSSVKHHKVSDDEAGQRIDNFLLRELKGLPRSRIYRLLRRGEIRIDGGRAKPTRRLRAGEVVRIPPFASAEKANSATQQPSTQLAEALRDGVLYEDTRLMVINKPSGLAVHGGSTVRIGLIEALRQIRPDLTFVELVHRLDQETSGCLLLAKRRSALRLLHEQLREGVVTKRYKALLVGEINQQEMAIDAPIEKLSGAMQERQVRISQDGRRAYTHLKVVERYADCTLVDIGLATGRTHQIRVHARHIGHPVSGDDRYGDRDANARLRREAGLRRLFLHSTELGFRHPEHGREMTVLAPLSADLDKLLQRLGKG